MGTLVRIAKRCGDAEAYNRPTDRAFANDYWRTATEQVFDTYYTSILQAKANARQMQEWAAVQQRNQEVADAHRRDLESSGFRMVNLLKLKVEASSMVGEKVAVTGRIFAPDNDAAIMQQDERDMNPILLDMRQASTETRRKILSRCSNLNSRCRFEVRGTISAASPKVVLALE